jgi:hypothetical protein
MPQWSSGFVKHPSGDDGPDNTNIYKSKSVGSNSPPSDLASRNQPPKQRAFGRRRRMGNRTNAAKGF